MSAAEASCRISRKALSSSLGNKISKLATRASCYFLTGRGQDSCQASLHPTQRHSALLHEAEAVYVNCILSRLLDCSGKKSPQIDVAEQENPRRFAASQGDLLSSTIWQDGLLLM